MMPATPAAPQSREIRVFLSSTFHDFMEERDLLVKQVFPSLRRRAQERGVEVVDVDLRWGITEEESQRGKVIGICLAEIERCRPYFIGMLGERYGWTPRADDYPDEVLEREELQWLKDYQGGVSLTELEILHGVLNDQEMAGRAFFYFRDPAWSRAQSEPGFICDTAEEQAKLLALKDRIRASGFPVAEDLPDPKAIAERIEADLWTLIEEQFPELDQADALEREERKHTSYRQSRLGVYLGQDYVDQLEALVSSGEQKILITGESGSGKSALIANWMERHAQIHPADLVYAHHLGCTNDTNALRPLLGRLIDTASAQLLEAKLISEPIKVPEDWWGLVAKVAETLQSLGHWCQQQGKRWIWVLDGLDRLDPDDQKALPWLPQSLPAGVQVVASALVCPVREILLERSYTTLAIQPLGREEQEQLIQRYLQRYTKELDGGLRQQVLSHPLAGSPLFLKVLLEELRQCGRHDTLQEQLAFYLSAQTVDDLYERVLERLENDGSGEAVKMLMTALWASRAGLTEPELLDITDLKPLQWAPIDLALEKAFGRNGSRLVFDHDFLRKAVEDRYLPTEKQQRQAHSELADCFSRQKEWDGQKAQELPWQLQKSGRISDLWDLLIRVSDLYQLARKLKKREVINYWLVARGEGDGELDELIAEAVEQEIEKRNEDSADQIRFVDHIAALLDEAGLYRALLLRLRTLSFELEGSRPDRDQARVLTRLSLLAAAYSDAGNYKQAKTLYERCLREREALLGSEHNSTIITAYSLAGIYTREGDYQTAESLYRRVLDSRERVLGKMHPKTLAALSKIGYVYDLCDQLGEAEKIYRQVLDARKELLGGSHRDTLTSMRRLASIYRQQNGKYKQAEELYRHVLAAREAMLGPDHPDTINAAQGLGVLYEEMDDYAASERLYTRVLDYRLRILGQQHPLVFTALHNLADISDQKGDQRNAESLYRQCLEGREKVLGADHFQTQSARYGLACILSRQGRLGESIMLRRRELAWCRQQNGDTDPGTLTSIHGLATDLRKNGELQESEQLYREVLAGRIASLGKDDRETMFSCYGLARCLSAQERYDEAIELRRLELAWCRQQNGNSDTGTLTSINGLAIDLRKSGKLDEAEALFRELLATRQQVLEPSDFGIGRALGGLSKTLEEAGKLEEAATFAQQALAHRLEHEGPDAWWTNRERLDLARVLHKLCRSVEATQLLDVLQASITSNSEPDDDDRQLLADAAALRDQIEASP